MSVLGIPFKRTPAVEAVRGIVARREAVLILLLTFEVAILSQLSPYFLTVSNLLDASRFFTEEGLIALGMTTVIITSGIDLSVGSTLAMVSVVIGFTFQAGLPMPLALAAGLLTGVAGGALNGFMVGYLRLNPLTVTLGTFSLFRGVAYLIAGSAAVSTFPGWFVYFGQYYFGQVPGQLVFLILVAVAVAVVLRKTPFGRYVYALGTAEKTVLYSGGPVRRVKLAAYALTGLMASVAGIVYTSRVSTSRGDAGLGLELAVIAAVVLGGASIYGGSGTILGTLLGVVILALLQNGLTLALVPSTWSQVAAGAVLVGAVFINERFRRSPT